MAEAATGVIDGKVDTQSFTYTPRFMIASIAGAWPSATARSSATGSSASITASTTFLGGFTTESSDVIRRVTERGRQARERSRYGASMSIGGVGGRGQAPPIAALLEVGKPEASPEDPQACVLAVTLAPATNEQHREGDQGKKGDG